MNICIFGASSNSIADIYFEECEKLGKSLAENGHNLVFGGGKSGLMGAVARGFDAGNGKIIGIAPKLFDTGDIFYENIAEMIITNDLVDRKALMIEKSEGFVVVPGGIGTFDEFFEIYAKKQLYPDNKPVVLFNVNGFYNHLYEFIKEANKEKFIDDGSLELIKISDDITEIVKLFNTAN